MHVVDLSRALLPLMKMLVLLNTAKRTRMLCAKCKQAHAKVYRAHTTNRYSVHLPIIVPIADLELMALALTR